MKALVKNILGLGLKRRILFGFLILMNIQLKAQILVHTDTLNSSNTSTNEVKTIFCDSLSCTFSIVIPSAVKAHYHQHHTENVMVIDGEAWMLLGDKEFKIKKGDLIVIPKGTVHSVRNLGETPLKVISIQAPFFDGKDRVQMH